MEGVEEGEHGERRVIVKVGSYNRKKQTTLRKEGIEGMYDTLYKHYRGTWGTGKRERRWRGERGLGRGRAISFMHRGNDREAATSFSHQNTQMWVAFSKERHMHLCLTPHAPSMPHY